MDWIRAKVDPIKKIRFFCLPLVLKLKLMNPSYLKFQNKKKVHVNNWLKELLKFEIIKMNTIVEYKTIIHERC